MTLAELAEKIRSDLVAGKIPVDELLLHIDPVLHQSAQAVSSQAEVKRLVNAIERRFRR
jgi:hypothetical protein